MPVKPFFYPYPVREKNKTPFVSLVPSAAYGMM